MIGALVSLLLEARVLPSALNARLVIGSECPLQMLYLTGAAGSETSQSAIVVSELPNASVLPSALIAMLYTLSSSPSRVDKNTGLFGSAISHSRTSPLRSRV